MKFLHIDIQYAILKTKKEQPPTRGWPRKLYSKIELPPLHSPKLPGWFFYALNHYRQNVNTNVSNAKMNIPKAIRSLKSKGFLSISTTPILCKNRGQPPCNTVALIGILSCCFSSDNSYNRHIAIKNKRCFARKSQGNISYLPFYLCATYVCYVCAACVLHTDFHTISAHLRTSESLIKRAFLRTFQP